MDRPTPVYSLISTKMGHHTGGYWLICGTKYCKDNQLQSQEHPKEILIPSNR